MLYFSQYNSLSQEEVLVNKKGPLVCGGPFGTAKRAYLYILYTARPR